MKRRWKMRNALVSVVTVLAMGALAGAIFKQPTNFGFFLVEALCICALIVFYLYPSGSAPELNIGARGETDSGSTGKLGFSVNPIPTVVGRPNFAPIAVAPTLTRIEDQQTDSEAVNQVVSKLRLILEGKEETDYAQAASLLEQHPEELRESWKLQLNYGNCLIMLGRYEGAQQIAEAILHRFSHIPPALAAAYDLLAQCLASRAPEAEGRLDSELLDQQLRYIDLGLEADPNYIGLYLNGFEVKCEQNDLEGAFDYLMKAVAISPSEAGKGIRQALTDNDELLSQFREDKRIRELVRILGIDIEHPTDGGEMT